MTKINEFFLGNLVLSAFVVICVFSEHAGWNAKFVLLVFATAYFLVIGKKFSRSFKIILKKMSTIDIKDVRMDHECKA